MSAATCISDAYPIGLVGFSHGTRVEAPIITSYPHCFKPLRAECRKTNMARYLDSGSGAADQYAGNWLDQNLIPGILGFRAQFGYFRFGALAPYAQALKVAAASGRPVHLVLGSNFGSLAASDVQRVMAAIAGRNATLTVVAFSGAEFHPKTIHITRADGSRTAIVGSSNWTQNGLGKNVEAAVVLDELEDDDAGVIQQIADAVERWRMDSARGVFPIESHDDIQQLVASGVINLPQPVRPIFQTGHRRRAPTLGQRKARWLPRAVRVPAPAEPLIMPPPPLATPAITSTVASSYRFLWRSKGLTERDLCIPTSRNTHPTGSMLWKQGDSDVDQMTWFRDVAFAGLDWQPDENTPHLERCHANFTLVVLGENVGTFNLRMTHNTRTDTATHAERNSMTQIHWGAAKPQVARRELLNSVMTLYRKEGSANEFMIEIN